MGRRPQDKGMVGDTTAAERLRRRVRRLLTFSRYQQTDLATALGLTQPDISRRLSGKVAFKVGELDTLAAFFGLTVPELFLDEYGRWDRRKRKRDRRSSVERRKLDLFSQREDPKAWHGYKRRLLPPPPDDEDA